MLVSWKWLKELVELDKSPDEIAQLLTMSGIEVESIKSLKRGIEGISVALVQVVKKHPQADRLQVCQVVTGGDRVVTVVSGATNLEVGQKVPLAQVGAVLANGMKIEKTDFRGIESEGMLCSVEELGLDADKFSSEERDGIYILPVEFEVGQDIVSLLGLDDFILELGLTPNRADCLGMVNVAREVAALTGGNLKLPVVDDVEQNGECADMTSIEIQEPSLCKRYVAKVIKDVKVAPSPFWLRHRLMSVGVRPINNIVDVTNYVMFEMGQPLHAFDYDLLAENRIVVRRGTSGEELVTLDGQKRSLNPDMLIIADAKKSVAIAGVMGGLETEVTQKTKTILLEAAFFNGPSVRRTSQALGLRSEASQRFEKEVDLEKVSQAAHRAVQLMAQIGAGTPITGNVDCFPNPEKRESIVLRLSRINQILGTDLTPIIVEDILELLQIKVVNKEANTWTVATPSHRRDLLGEIDLIEEVARLYGYDKIPTTLPQGATTQGKRTWEQKVRSEAASLLSMQGLYQVITFSFINPRHFDWLMLPEEHPLRDAVAVSNPLSEEQGVMRTTVLPGLLEVVRKNSNKRNKDLAIYELGKVYFKEGFLDKTTLPKEKYILTAAAAGFSEKNWAYPAIEYNYYYLKGVLEQLLSRLGIRLDEVAFLACKDMQFLHPGRSAKIMIRDQEAGWIGEIHPLVLENYEIEQKTTIFTLDLELLTKEANERIAYQSIPRYPAVTRDLAVIVPENTEVVDVTKLIQEKGQPWLKQISLFDQYKGKQIEKGFKSLAFSLSWQAEDRTLTDEEVNLLHKEILVVLALKVGAKLRV
ncbi:MAG: phenylalanine--tRNA ligase subunit beta [Firmicutes bacterium HGW-Firmicutes-12]|nr:MAG: phenylalanine--tRNA ligase subunit beta [Firmicutes bacterium HGW-Firmicutes-12]